MAGSTMNGAVGCKSAPVRRHQQPFVWLLLTLLLLVCCTNAAAAVGIPFGSLRLCPTGGRSFVMAWNLACEMKRKKRSVEETTSRAGSMIKRHSTDDYRPATLSEVMKICCEVGCQIRDLLAYCDPFGPWNS